MSAMDRDTLRALAARCEAATDERFIRDVFITLHKASLISDGAYDRAMALLNVSAYLDAALTLVPEGWRVNTADWSIAGKFSWMLRGPCKQYVPGSDGYPEAGDDWFKQGISLATPALALTAAALRALAEEAGNA